MTPDRPRSFWADFRLFFFRGLGVLLPTVLTLWILIYAALFVQRSVAEPINAGLRQLVLYALPQVVDADHLPDWFTVSDDQVAQLRAERRRDARAELSDDELRASARGRNLQEWWNARWYLRVTGLVVAIVLIYLAGRVLGGIIGRRMYARVENAFQRLPVVAQVYPHVKQVVEVFFGNGEQKVKFNRVVLVEYPRRGIWTVGLLTGESMKGIESSMQQEGVTVFIPSSPTPFTGYTITVPRDEAIDLPISIDEALRFVVSGGVLVPPREMPDYISQSGQMKDEGGLADGPRDAMMGGPATPGGRGTGPDDGPDADG